MRAIARGRQRSRPPNAPSATTMSASLRSKRLPQSNIELERIAAPHAIKRHCDVGAHGAKRRIVTRTQTRAHAQRAAEGRAARTCLPRIDKSGDAVIGQDTLAELDTDGIDRFGAHRLVVGKLRP